MEGKAAPSGSSSSSSSSSSSLPSELFGRKGPSPPTGLFDSVFSPPVSSAQVVSRGSPCTVSIGSLTVQEHANQVGNAQSATQGQVSQEVRKREFPISNRDITSIFPDEKTETFSLSNSLYYGGQDICVLPRPPESSNVYKDGGDDDLGNVAHRGDWWQGTLLDLGF